MGSETSPSLYGVGNASWGRKRLLRVGNASLNLLQESETLPSTFGVIRSLRLLPFLSAAWLDSSQPLWSVDTRKLLVCSLHQVQVHLKL